MDGSGKTSTHDVTVSILLSLFSKSKTLGNASEGTPTLSGHLTRSLLVIVVRCCSTCLARGNSQTKEQARIYIVKAMWGLVLKEVAGLS
jgi:hypothetical protein